MKIAITASGSTMEAVVDPRFGRCPYFLIIETDDMSCEAVANPGASAGGGAGIQAGQLVAEKGATVVLTGNCGPNAHRTLSAAGVAVIVGVAGPVRDAAEAYKSGTLKPAATPNVGSHFGMGGTAQ